MRGVEKDTQLDVLLVGAEDLADSALTKTVVEHTRAHGILTVGRLTEFDLCIGTCGARTETLEIGRQAFTGLENDAPP